MVIQRHTVEMPGGLGTGGLGGMTRTLWYISRMALRYTHFLTYTANPVSQLYVCGLHGTVNGHTMTTGDGLDLLGMSAKVESNFQSQRKLKKNGRKQAGRTTSRKLSGKENQVNLVFG